MCQGARGELAKGDGIVDGSDMIKAWTFRRLPEQDQWSAKEVKDIKATPVKTEERVIISTPPDDPEMVIPPPPPRPTTAHRLHITQGDISRFGYTAGCAGCRALRLGGRRQGHSEMRRRRIIDLIKSEAGGAQRVQDHEDRRRAREQLRAGEAHGGGGSAPGCPAEVRCSPPVLSIFAKHDGRRFGREELTERDSKSA